MIFHVTGAGTTLTVNASDLRERRRPDQGRRRHPGPRLAQKPTSATPPSTAALKLAGGTNTIFAVYTTAASVGQHRSHRLRPEPRTSITAPRSTSTATTRPSATCLAAAPPSCPAARSSTAPALPRCTSPSTPTRPGPATSATPARARSTSSATATTPLTVNSPNTFGGTVTLTGGATTLIDLGTFQNASAVNVTRAALIWNDTGTQAVANRLSATAPITLTGGGFQFQGRDATGSTPVDAISLGTLNLGVGASDIVVNNGQGAALRSPSPASAPAPPARTLNFGAGGNSPGDGTRMLFTAAPTLTNGIIGGWFTTTGLDQHWHRRAAASASPSPPTTRPPACGRSSTRPPTPSARASTRSQRQHHAPRRQQHDQLPDASARSAAITLSFVNATDTLTVQSGGILAGTDANSKTIGSHRHPGADRSRVPATTSTSTSAPTR